jgi:hypothetical protein
MPTIRDGEIIYRDHYNRDVHHPTCCCERCIADKRHAEIMAALKPATCQHGAQGMFYPLGVHGMKLEWCPGCGAHRIITGGQSGPWITVYSVKGGV